MGFVPNTGIVVMDAQRVDGDLSVNLVAKSWA